MHTITTVSPTAPAAPNTRCTAADVKADRRSPEGPGLDTGEDQRTLTKAGATPTGDPDHRHNAAFRAMSEDGRRAVWSSLPCGDASRGTRFVGARIPSIADLGGVSGPQLARFPLPLGQADAVRPIGVSIGPPCGSQSVVFPSADRTHFVGPGVRQRPVAAAGTGNALEHILSLADHRLPARSCRTAREHPVASPRVPEMKLADARADARHREPDGEPHKTTALPLTTPEPWRGRC